MEFFKKNKIIIFIIFLAAFLRLYRLGENFGFEGELGDNLLAVKDAIFQRQIPLLGPPTSHPWLYFGPLYYWLLIPLTIVFNFNPLVIAYVGVAAGILVVILNFAVIGKIFSQKAAFFSSFLLAISFLFVGFSRGGRFMFLVTVFFYPLMWLLYQVWRKKRRSLFCLGLVLGIMLNFHLTSLILAPVIFMIFWKRRRLIEKKGLFLVSLGFLLPNLPFLIYDISHRLEMTRKFLVWVPYRLAGFLGFYPKNNLSKDVIMQTLEGFNKFISSSFVPDNFVPDKEIIGWLLTAIVVGFFLLNFKKGTFGWFFLRWAGVFSFLILFIHTSPPIHYFVPILPLPVIIFSLLLEQLWRKFWGKIVVFLLLPLILFLNFRFFFSANYFYRSQDKIAPEIFYVPFSLQKRLVRTVVEDARGEPFSLSRVGPYDYFEKSFAQNYLYLAWWFGNEPIDNADIRYMIYEDSLRLPEKIVGKIIYKQDGLTVVKKQNEKR